MHQWLLASARLQIFAWFECGVSWSLEIATDKAEGFFWARRRDVENSTIS